MTPQRKKIPRSLAPARWQPIDLVHDRYIMLATMNDSHSSRTSTEESSHASSSRRSRSSRSIISSTSSRTSRTSAASRSASSRASGSSRYSRSSHGQRPQQGQQQLSTIRSLSSAASASSSSSRAELSVPSSFGGRAAQRALVKRGEASVESQSEGSETMQLALRVERETRPMMHLLRVLKEMEGKNDGGKILLPPTM